MELYPPASDVSDYLIIYATEKIELAEELIRYDIPIHGFTWTPNPKKLPSTDMTKSHKTLVPYLVMLLSCMYSGCIVPELNENGNIHYHGWYQLKDSYKYYKICLPKMKNIGFIKINKLKHIKINDYEPTDNALYYYKKELCIWTQLFGTSYITSVDTMEQRKKRLRQNVQTMLDQELDLIQERNDLEGNIRLFLHN